MNNNQIKCVRCNKKRSIKKISKYELNSIIYNGICCHCRDEEQSEANAVRFYELFNEE